MNTPTQNDTAGMLMALTQGVASWFAMTPDIKHVQDKMPVTDPDFAKDFRRSEVTAGGITLAIGAIGSLILKSFYPFLASVLIVAVLAVAYEWAFLAVPPTTEKEVTP